VFSLSIFFESFWLGLLTPLGAVCVLPLYPGFISFLARKLQTEPSRKTYALFGVLVSAGVILFMLLLGLVFNVLFPNTISNAVDVVSPIAFTIMALISISLIFNIDFGKYLPKAKTPQAKNPLVAAFLFGLFFGAIVIPCNPAFIALFLARSATVSGFLNGMLNVLAFGIGMAFPLILFTLISGRWSQAIIAWLTKWHRKINIVAGLIMLGISLYYLFFVFKVQNMLF
jgi:cytochrome c-type biogenesis protein